MVHYLQIHGLGTLYLRSVDRRQSMEIQANGGRNLLEHLNTHQPETFGEVAELICAGQAITEAWEDQHLIPIVADKPLVRLPTQYAELADWLATEDCPYAIMGYLSDPNLPRSVRFDFQGYQFNLVNRRTDVWNQDVMFFQERDHDLMFNYRQDTVE